MKKSIIITAAVLGLALSGQCQILVYKNSITRTTTGNGSTVKHKLSGYTVIDTQTLNVTRVESEAVTKNFQVWEIAYVNDVIRGAAAKNFTVFSEVDDHTDGNGNDVKDCETLKGLNVLLDIGDVHNINKWSVPKSFAIVGQTFYTLNGQPTLDETTGTLVFDSKNTVDLNVLGKTFDETVQAVENLLQNLGYTQQ